MTCKVQTSTIPLNMISRGAGDGAAGSSSDLSDSALHDQEMWVVHIELH